MNPMTNMKNVLKLSEQDLKSGGVGSWHNQYSGSAWIFVGGLLYDLTEGDILCVFSQYGEVVNVNLVRDKATGKSKGFAFICYEDQRSTVLAVDNLNGIKLVGKTIRVDHVQDYRPPKETDKMDAETQQLLMEGCAPEVVMRKQAEGRSDRRTPERSAERSRKTDSRVKHDRHEPSIKREKERR
ncbi:RNA-binding motif protein, X-linked 2 [Anopheles moucheti]|uniref:RNA-binding motif protein, X-linked 2 n=1 Tax=Anopheles moucheti TaxID=186751 RepID=UPI0022F10283|nr:RNA-binding motif protein, X-linked 2 [Anopheles moucheti]